MASTSRAKAAESSMLGLPPDHVGKHPFANQLCLLSTARRMHGHINPYLEHVACGHSLGVNHASKDRLWGRSLAKDDIGRFTRPTLPQVLPGRDVGWPNAFDIYVRRYALYEAEL